MSLVIIFQTFVLIGLLASIIYVVQIVWKTVIY